MTERPLYMNETQIAVAVLGTERAHEWPAVLRQLNIDYGTRFPPVNPRMGGRFWPDVVKYFEFVNHLDKINADLATRMREVPTRAGATKRRK